MVVQAAFALYSGTVRSVATPYELPVNYLGNHRISVVWESIVPTNKALDISKRSLIGLFGQFEAVDMCPPLDNPLSYARWHETWPKPYSRTHRRPTWLRENRTNRNPKNAPLLSADRHLPPTNMDKAGAGRPKLVLLLLTARDASR